MSAQKLLLLLLGGALVNVAVAWGCALWSTPASKRDQPSALGVWPREVGDRWPTDGVYVSRESAFGLRAIKSWAIERHRRDPAAALSGYLDIRRNGPQVDGAPDLEAATALLTAIESDPGGDLDQQVQEVLSLLRREARGLDAEIQDQIKTIILSLTQRNRHFSLHVRETGWPLRSMDAEARSDRAIQPFGPQAIRLPRVRAGVILSSSGRWLPLHPRPVEFAINTCLYAALLWPLTLVPSGVLRSIRRRAGQCPSCGRSIGVAGSCDECGHDLSDFWG